MLKIGRGIYDSMTVLTDGGIWQLMPVVGGSFQTKKKKIEWLDRCRPLTFNVFFFKAVLYSKCLSAQQEHFKFFKGAFRLYN